MAKKTIFARIASAGAVAALATAGLGLTSAPAEAMGCGYQYISGDYWYNHCGSGNVKIRIDRVIGGEYVCFGPGATPITRGLNHPTNAYYVGKC